MEYHKPVLIKEVLKNLDVKKEGEYIDATLGDAGHTLEILRNGGKVLGLEILPKALERATERIVQEGFIDNFIGVNGNFKDIEEISKNYGFEAVDGILYDLGFSSYEIDESGLGLSFQKDEPLDMRMDKNLGVTAADLVNSLSEKELAILIIKNSGEKLARRFAKAIVEARGLKKIQTTGQLAQILESVASPGYERGRIHPATRTFQALRIVVNDEVVNLKESLPRAARVLLPGSKILVISFHSLEDKVAKEFGQSARLSIKDVVTPSEEEIRSNPRSRSAKLRVFIKND